MAQQLVYIIYEPPAKRTKGHSVSQKACGRSSSCKRDDKLSEDTLQKARLTRQHQGFHECEVSYGGEADLHKFLVQCDKNPGHQNFTPIRDFKLEHLPPHYQDELIVDWIRACADLTCRVAVRYTSNDRPEFFPGTTTPFPFFQDRGTNFMRAGTGWVSGLYMYSEGENVKCECEECSRSGNAAPKKARGEIHFRTAAHLVYDKTESAKSTCQFFYDESQTDLGTLLTFHELGVYKCDTKGDHCILNYVTHDSELLDRLDKIVKRCKNLTEEVWNKYTKDDKNNSEIGRSEMCERNFEENLCVCISHPHGCSKQVSVGTWTHRQSAGKTKTGWYREDGSYDGEDTWYRYNTPTCKGSSGAPLLTPVGRWVCVAGEVWWDGLQHPHSGGCQGNDNRSAVKSEFT